jgi:hypothetical protein
VKKSIGFAAPILISPTTSSFKITLMNGCANSPLADARGYNSKPW